MTKVVQGLGGGGRGCFCLVVFFFLKQATLNTFYLKKEVENAPQEVHFSPSQN